MDGDVTFLSTREESPLACRDGLFGRPAATASMQWGSSEVTPDRLIA
jgi:hypothetical protein